MNEKNCPICHTSIPEHAPGGFCPACVLRGADEPAPDLPNGPILEEVAAAFPKLEILRLIGHGGMGYVYQARQPDLDRMVALKILSPALRRDPAFEERFAREARVLGKLKHPNIVTLYEHGESGGYFYLMMEFVDGVNLRQAMSAGRFSPEQALAIVPAVCDALQSAHAQGVWHRDIKPENILLDHDGRVKIADFGIARIIGDSERNFTLTRTGGLLGSAAYMAPEQHEKPHSVDHRADIYSLGVVIYEMLTGELPLGRFPLPSQRAEVGKRIDEIVLRTLEKERELRQQSAEEVKTEVVHAKSRLEQKTLTGGLETKPDSMSAWFLGLFLGGLLLIAAASIFTSGSTQGVSLALATTSVVAGYVGSLVALATMRNGKVSRRWRTGLRIVAWIPPSLLVMGLAWAILKTGIASGSVERRRLETRKRIDADQLRHEQQRKQKEESPDGSFGPTIDRIVPQPGPGTPCLLDFDTGKLITPPDDLAEKLRTGSASLNEADLDWLRKNGLDAGINSPALSLRLFEGAANSCKPSGGNTWNFDEWTPAQVVSNWQDSHEAQHRFDTPNQTFYATPALSPHAMAFLTREGTMGVLEVFGYSVNPPGVRIRYKMLQNNPGSRSTAFESSDEFSFGPVVERVVHDNSSGPDEAVIDLDTGLQPAMRPDGKAESWMLENGIDATGDTDPDIKGLIATSGMVAIPIPADSWETSTPADLRQKVAPLEPSTATAISGKGGLPSTFAFKTRDNGIGILQIVEFTEPRKGVRIRYKLLTLKKILLGPSEKAARDLISSARVRDKSSVSNGLSRSYRLGLLAEGNDPTKLFEELGHLHILESHTIDKNTSEVLVESDHPSRRRCVLRMTLEGGEWKLMGIGQ